MAKAKMPTTVSPMLCTLTKAPIEDPDYLYEMKWDGYRIIAIKEKSTLRMNSRSGLDYTSKYPPVAKAIKNLEHDVILDGEVVVFNQEGKPDFDALQLYNGHNTPIKYCVFDLLWLDGADLTQLPLEQRKNLLKALVENDETFYFSESYDDGNALYEMSLDHNLEGIVAKDRNSTYQQGGRNSSWLKIPTRKRQEFLIGGWAESDKTRSFKSLLFGAYENGKFNWIGRSGGGYKHSEMPGILKKLEELEIPESPFANKILDTKGAKTHFVKPELVANFEFATWTKSGRIRKPATFLGFRYDKDPKDVVREVPKETKVIEKEHEEEEIYLDADIENTSGPGQEAELSAKPHKKQTTKERKSAEAQLEAYFDKRRFDKTAEPTGGDADSEKLIFVVQKHDASHLHYDFRLQMRGVLKSWAVPKGPSLDPKEHRLAMQVEDHPYDYKDFEGIIPKGQYGGGTVIVWDTGYYEPTEKINGKAAQEHYLLSHYYKNKLEITLHGKKLNGKFLIERMKSESEGEDEDRRAWRLVKVKDSHARKSEITDQEESVISGMTIEEMAENANADVWNSDREDESAAGQKKRNSKAKPPKEDETEAAETSSEIQEASEQAPTKHKTVGDLYPKQAQKKLMESSNWTKIIEEKIISEGEINIEGQTLTLTNIEKKLWKDTNKAQLIAYYNQVAEYILPHLKDRPLSLHIKNLSAQAPGFYIKDAEGMAPKYAEIFSTKRKHPKPGKRNQIDYIVCNNLPTLIYLINLGNIDLNPWNSTTKNYTQPDFIAIDLDPSDDDRKKVVRTAKAAKQYLDSKKLTAFVKTSGKTGMHIFVPCEGFSYPQARTLAEHICEEIHRLVPKITTTEVSTSHRGNKLFVDFSQNDEADTLACAYSARPAKSPTVSTPLEWDEVNDDLDPKAFTIESIAERLKDKGDLWKELNSAKIRKANSKILFKLIEGE
jgi:bifunctional non-homologous end joining protein LigD